MQQMLSQLKNKKKMKIELSVLNWHPVFFSNQKTLQ